MRRRIAIPPDVRAVLDEYASLGHAARRALHLSERVARLEVERAVARAARLAERLRRA